MVTLKRLMNVMALSVLLGAISTPVMMKADPLHTFIGTGFQTASFGCAWLALQKAWEMCDNTKSILNAYKELIKAGKDENIFGVLFDRRIFVPMALVMSGAAGAWAAYQYGESWKKKQR